MKQAIDILLKAWGKFKEDGCFSHAGAIAYNSMLSVIPMFLLFLLALSHILPKEQVIESVGYVLQLFFPVQSQTLIGEIDRFTENRTSIGIIMGGTLLFFSTLAFSSLDGAMNIIFKHRKCNHKRHPAISMLLPHVFMIVLGIGLLLLTMSITFAHTLENKEVARIGMSLAFLDDFAMQTFGILIELFLMTAFYKIFPVGGIRMKHALIGGGVATLFWELSRRGLAWYLTSLSQAGLVYGSLATALTAMLCLEIASIILLFGAQIIAVYELEQV